MQTLLVTPHHRLRRDTEICIRDVYEQVHGAHIDTFPQTLIAATDRLEMPVCAAGLRFAGCGFFSESYLEDPIDRILGRRTGRQIERERIFEVTTLASRKTNAVLPFVREIVEFGQTNRYDWAFFTATARLRTLLTSMGLPLEVLGRADPKRIPHSERWGNYYHCGPQVCAIDARRLEARPPEADVRYAHA